MGRRVLEGGRYVVASVVSVAGYLVNFFIILFVHHPFRSSSSAFNLFFTYLHRAPCEYLPQRTNDFGHLQGSSLRQTPDVNRPLLRDEPGCGQGDRLIAFFFSSFTLHLRYLPNPHLQPRSAKPPGTSGNLLVCLPGEEKIERKMRGIEVRC